MNELGSRIDLLQTALSRMSWTDVFVLFLSLFNAFHQLGWTRCFIPSLSGHLDALSVSRFSRVPPGRYTFASRADALKDVSGRPSQEHVLRTTAQRKQHRNGDHQSAHGLLLWKWHLARTLAQVA